MTSEVAVLNKAAVALAADSVVTIESAGQRKTFNSANKLFTLSKHHPVGVMVYGSAEINGMPWETLIKMFRSQLEKRSFDTVEQYCNSFFRFLRQSLQRNKTGDKLNIRAILLDLFIGQHFDIIQILREHLEKTNGKIDKTIINKEVKHFILKQFTEFRKFPKCRALSKVSRADIKKSYDTLIVELIHEIFGSLSLSLEIRKSLHELAIIALKSLYFSNARSGIVISGFGNKQEFPELIAYDFDGTVCGKLKFNLHRRVKIDERNAACVAPFAQTQMVARFMEGVDRDYRVFSQTVYETFVNQYLGEAAKKAKISNAIETKIRMHLKSGFAALLTETSKYINQKFVQPILQSVRVLSKEDLANLAESLITITSLQQRVSLDVETVGGPVDVAVISKGDGFIWIKRKHYFKPDLNPSFIASYLR